MLNIHRTSSLDSFPRFQAHNSIIALLGPTGFAVHALMSQTSSFRGSGPQFAMGALILVRGALVT